MTDGEHLVSRGKAAKRRGQLKDAAEYYRRAVDAFDAVGDLMRGIHAARHLAEIDLDAGHLEEATLRIAEVLLFYRGREVPRLEMANTLRVAALVDQRRGFRDEARLLWCEARSLYEREGVKDGVVEADRWLMRLANA
jgi:tetratricopeptide (TPR) repeat protein